MDKIKRDALIQEYIDKGFSVIPINEKKRPYIKWKEFQNRHPTNEEIKEWGEKYPEFNTGIVTGEVSHFYVLDFDSVEAFNYFPDALKNTMTTRTARGLHLCYTAKEKYQSRIIELNGQKIEFRGEHEYTIEPYAVINGFEYQIVKSVKEIKELPLFVIELLMEKKHKNRGDNTIITSEQKDRKVIHNIYVKTRRLCVYEILNRGLSIGERDISFFILRNVLLKDHHNQSFVNHVVEEKNNLLSDPLEPKEVEAILNADMYPITCKYIRTHLPYVSCKRCPMNKEDEKIDFDGVLSNKKLNTRDIKVAYALLYGYRTVGSIVKKTGYTKQEVYNSLMKLKKSVKKN